ncbi:MAG: BON domain-containing protein [Zoogloea sp.]|nr:BON domain-containing protein [Zoogloea sp.]
MNKQASTWKMAGTLGLALLAAGWQNAAQAQTTTGGAATRAGQALDDTAITTKVKAALLGKKGINATDISVSTSQGRVTLTGSVPSAQIRRAEDIVRAVDGVVSVDNRLVASTAATGSTAGQTTATRESVGEYVDDATITTRVKAALAKAENVPSTAIKVETYRGVVQLSGFVDSDAIAKRAVEVARAVPGVRSVQSGIRSKPPARGTTTQ